MMTPAATIKVRFPPSPTGRMHIGNARTALFNWLYARHNKGQFLFRIEDTDAERSTPENIAFIYEGLEWLGLNYDNEPFLQTTRQPAHVETAQKLVSEGKAYVDDEGVTRFRVPAGATTWKDLVQGEITIENKQVEDFALLRSNGTPTYHLGVVCDDLFMGVTHILRGDDHINNTPKHIMLFQAIGAQVPFFGHFPMILGKDGEKLSKRHGATSIQDLRDLGYLPQAVFNYTIRLGWSSGDKELFTKEEAVELFDISHISKSAARFDLDKLNWLNSHYLKTLPFAEILPHLQRFLPGAAGTSHQSPVTSHELSRIEKLWPELSKRATTLPEAVTAAMPFITDPTTAYTPEHTKILLEGHDTLHIFYEALNAATDWSVPALDALIQHLVAEKFGGKFPGKPVRIALTAVMGGPHLPDIMSALGQTETLRRLKVALHHIHENGGHH